MTINFEIDVILKNNLTPNQFTLLYTIYHNRAEFTKLLEMFDEEYVLKELEFLCDKGYIIVYKDAVNISDYNIIVTELFTEIISIDTSTNYFEEFIKLYPVKVQRTDGLYDYLRTDLSRCKKLYNKLVNGKKAKHEKLIDLLKYELQIRQQENSMKYMKRLPKWISSEEWKVFEERRKSEGSSNGLKNTGYGTTLI